MSITESLSEVIGGSGIEAGSVTVAGSGSGAGPIIWAHGWYSELVLIAPIWARSAWAAAVLNVAFGESTMAVDTHIFRLGNRTGIAPGATPRAVEDALLRRVPPELLRDAHHWLILHGRYVCKARVPECWRCVGAPWCRYSDKTPAPVAKPARGPIRHGRA